MHQVKLVKLAPALVGSLGMGLASADDVAFFPYISSGPTFTSLVSVVNTSSRLFDTSYTRGTGTGFNRMHWVYAYKSGAAATDNLAPCAEIDFPLPSSRNDIQTVDMGGHFGSTTLGVLFNDPSSNNDWNKARDDGLTYAMATIPAKPNRGYLLVANADDDPSRQTIWGEAVSYEFGSGAAWGYEALANNGVAWVRFTGTGAYGAVSDDDTQGGSAYDFSFPIHNARISAMLNGGQGSPVTFMPPREVETRLYITPENFGPEDVGFDPAINGSMLKAGGVPNAGQYITSVAMLAGETGLGVAYTRDEVMVSGSSPKQVRCVGALRIADFIDSYNNDTHPLRNGGWGNVLVDHVNSDPAIRADPTYADYQKDTRRAMAYKLEYNLGSTFNGELLESAHNYNNGTDLRANFILTFNPNI